MADPAQYAAALGGIWDEEYDPDKDESEESEYEEIGGKLVKKAPKPMASSIGSMYRRKGEREEKKAKLVNAPPSDTTAPPPIQEDEAAEQASDQEPETGAEPSTSADPYLRETLSRIATATGGFPRPPSLMTPTSASVIVRRASEAGSRFSVATTETRSPIALRQEKIEVVVRCL